MSQADLREHWEQKLTECETSGQTITAWCGEQKIGLAKFYYWKRKLRSKNQAAGDGANPISPISWLPLEFDLKGFSGERTADQISIEIGSQFKVVVQKGFDHEMLRDVVNILKQP